MVAKTSFDSHVNNRTKVLYMLLRKKSIILWSLIMLSVPSLLYGQQINSEYLISAEEIANPERGWYDDYYSFSGISSTSEYLPLTADELTTYRELSGITLILRLFYLHQFVDDEKISEEYLALMQADFDAIRAAGVKCVIRFAYSNSLDNETWDTTPEIVLKHIESVAPVLSNNSDVIAAVQAGFVGVWGEWYYTENFAGNNYSPSEEDLVNRRAVVNALLEGLPESITVQGRTPNIMKSALETDEPISSEEAFSGSDKARLGHHNDCFLANVSDQGTYIQLTADLEYLNETTKYTIAGVFE